MFCVQSCVVENFRKITSKTYAPIDFNTVELYFSKTPNKDYEEIALIKVNLESHDCCFNNIKKLAAKIGANSVINIKEDSHGFVFGVAVRWK